MRCGSTPEIQIISPLRINWVKEKVPLIGLLSTVGCESIAGHQTWIRGCFNSNSMMKN